MKPPEGVVIPANRQVRRKGFRQNTMNFPQGLRDAIPTTPGCWGRALALESIDGDCANSALYGKKVRLRFLVAETGKLTGRFDVQAHLNLDAARELARSLTELVERVEKMPVSFP